MDSPLLSFGEIEDEIGESSTQHVIEIQKLQSMIRNFEEVANKFSEASIQHNVKTWALQAPMLNFEEVGNEFSEAGTQHNVEIQALQVPMLNFEEVGNEFSEAGTQHNVEIQALQVYALFFFNWTIILSALLKCINIGMNESILNFEEVTNEFSEAGTQDIVEMQALQIMNDPILSFEKVVYKTREGSIQYIVESQEILQIMNNLILSFKEMAEIEDQEKSETGELYVGKSFGSWNEVILFLNEVCKRKSFGYHKGRFKKDDEQNVKKRTFLCRHSGTFNSCKTAPLENQCNTQSCKVNCPWHLNINQNSESNYVVTC
ncbi:protein far1-related sequence 5-like [Gigaspora margarita]|uniref:Protein far1-related sequence 5-like n=1 Tax=Gigaspora margarita TaxID=4874 RepID=A0A8H4A8S9_GIGMA|nr:protein far1-related sequence 5-like [Gigaspora margarita]